MIYDLSKVCIQDFVSNLKPFFPQIHTIALFATYHAPFVISIRNHNNKPYQLECITKPLLELYSCNYLPIQRTLISTTHIYPIATYELFVWATTPAHPLAAHPLAAYPSSTKCSLPIYLSTTTCPHNIANGQFQFPIPSSLYKKDTASVDYLFTLDRICGCPCRTSAYNGDESPFLHLFRMQRCIGIYPGNIYYSNL